MNSSASLDAGVRSANLESMQQTFFYERGAVGSAVLVRSSMSPGRLDRLLRYHEPESVPDLAEIHMRDLFDALFAYYSLVEIGAQVGAVPDPLPRGFQADALRILPNPACRAYYHDRYPLYLPQALLRRIEDRGPVLMETGPTTVSIPGFQKLLAFELGFSSDDEIGVILRLLDSFSIGGESLHSVVEHAKTVEHYLAAVSSPPGQAGVMGRALRGFGKLLGAMLRLDALLATCEECPLLQSSIWRYYEYWIRKASVEHGLLDIVSSWKALPVSDDSDGESEALDEYLQQVRAALSRLTSPRHRLADAT